jgi:hypothetical protein
VRRARVNSGEYPRAMRKYAWLNRRRARNFVSDSDRDFGVGKRNFVAPHGIRRARPAAPSVVSPVFDFLILTSLFLERRRGRVPARASTTWCPTRRSTPDMTSPLGCASSERRGKQRSHPSQKCATLPTGSLHRRQQRRRRDGEAERLGGLEVDDELELGRLLDGEIGGLCALEDLVDERCCATPELYRVSTVR